MQKLGVEVIIEDLSSHPHCEHGPTLLFERYSSGPKNGRQFFACSACRDRKDCQFFCWADDAHLLKKKESMKINNKTLNKQVSCRLDQFRSLAEENRKFCKSCQCLLLPEEWKKHTSHGDLVTVLDENLKYPSYFLKPLENSKKEAQYLFSKTTVQYLCQSIKQMGFTHVLCVGCPRLHETIINEEPSLSSLLLDIDNRYKQFFNPSQFCYYNVFNHYFFNEEDKENNYKPFLQRKKKEKLIVFLDPPFGGLIETLCHTVKQIEEDSKNDNKGNNELQLFWIFPYFMEERLIASLPSLKMMDYQIDYDNHPLFTSGKGGRKHGSPVRVFTNMNPLEFLPPNDDYRLCKPCGRYVHNNNRHCPICNECCSKDGRQYVHCDLCKKCVKPSRQHCVTCNACLPEDHQCGQITKQGCHICGDLSHKRRTCPLKSGSNMKRKKTKNSSAKKKKLKR